MVLKEEEKEAEVLGIKDEVGPPIDVMTTLSANLYDARKCLSAIQEYVEDVQKISKGIKGISLMNSNMHGYVSAQSAIDVAKDVTDLIGGKRITTIAEMQEKLKEEEEELKRKVTEAEDKEQQYTY